MVSKSIFSFLALSLLTLAKVNGYIVDTYIDKCNDVSTYLKSQGKRNNLQYCKMNDEGEIIELTLYSYCLEDEQLATVLSYNTIEKLIFKRLFIDWSIDDRDDNNIIFTFGCTSLPTNYEALSTLTNLKSLDLHGIQNLDYAMITSIPKSVEQLTMKKIKLTQEIVDALSELTNLYTLELFEIGFSEELDFSKFRNLKNLTILIINNTSFIYENIFMNCPYLKQLLIRGSTLSLKSISYLTNLEELQLDGALFPDGFYFLKNLKNLTSLTIRCSDNYRTYLANISPYFFYLTELKRLTILSCETTISTSSEDSLTWANLKNLEHLNSQFNSPTTFELKYIGDLPNLKEVFLTYNRYTTALPESIGNLKNLEVLDLTNNEIISVPETIGNLEKIKILRLGSNKITNIPSSIGNLKNLEELFLYGNLIDDYLPESLNNLPKLRVFFRKFKY